MDLFTQYAVVSSMQALDDAGVIAEGIAVDDESGKTPINPDKAGVIWGSGVGGFQSFMDEAKNFFQGDGSPRFSPFFIPMMIPDIAAGHIIIATALEVLTTLLLVLALVLPTQLSTLST